MENTENTENVEIDYKKLYIQALADYANLKRRTEQVNDFNYKNILNALLSDFFPIYVDAKRGLQYNEKGCELIYNKFIKILKLHGVVPLDLNYIKENFNEDFSDMYAEAIGIEPTNSEELDNKVYSVLEDGFINIRENAIIIPAKVIVFKFNND